MAVVSQIATIVISGATGSRTWIATAATQDTAVGSSVVITVTQSNTGASPPGVADTLTLEYRNDAAGVIKSVALTPGSASQTNTFFFTTNGLSGGSNRAGTVELVLHAVKTTGGGTATYDVETDGAPNTPPTGFSTTQLDRGWIRATVVANYLLSNVSSGGAQTEPAEYDESLFGVIVTTTLYVARAFTVATNAGSLSGNTNNTTSSSHTITYANVIDERFAAGVTNVLINSVTIPNATLTGQPDFVIASTATVEDLDVDPRLTCTHHLQIDDSTFALADADTSGKMLSTQTGFLATRFVGSRGTGIDGLTVTQTLTPVLPGTAVSGSSSTATRDGQAGWTDLLTWSSSKPGGAWNKTVDVTAPTDIDGPTYLLSDTTTYTMLAADPRVTLIVAGGNLANTDTHWTPGNDLTVGLGLIKLYTRVAFDSGTPTMALIQFNPATGAAEFFDSDLTWKTGDTVYFWALTPSAGDAKLALKTFTGTAAWPTRDIYLIGACEYLGTPYESNGQVTVVGASNAHDIQRYASVGEVR